MENLIEVRNLNKYFGKKHILKDVSFKISSGEILGFIGPNGRDRLVRIR